MAIIIGLAGRKRSGKDTLAHALRDTLADLGYSSTVCRFVDPLRAALYALDPSVPATSSVFPPGRLQTLVADYGWEEIKGTPYGPEVRRLLQRLGTDAIRAVDDNLWVRALEETLRTADPDFVIVPDVRFPNEADLVWSMDGWVIRVTRPDLPDDGDTHSSEHAMDDVPVDIELCNDGDVDHIRAAARVIVRQLVVEAPFEPITVRASTGAVSATTPALPGALDSDARLNDPHATAP